MVDCRSRIGGTHCLTYPKKNFNDHHWYTTGPLSMKSFFGICIPALFEHQLTQWHGIQNSGSRLLQLWSHLKINWPPSNSPNLFDFKSMGWWSNAYRATLGVDGDRLLIPVHVMSSVHRPLTISWRSTRSPVRLLIWRTKANRMAPNVRQSS